MISIERVNTEDVLPLRQQVLWPDHPIDFCRVPDDHQAWHYAVKDKVYKGQRIISVASIYIDRPSARLRKLATHANHQGQGLATQLLHKIIDDLRNAKITSFWCDARETAISFYSRLGMTIVSDRFYKNDIAYYKMFISLKTNSTTL